MNKRKKCCVCMAFFIPKRRNNIYCGESCYNKAYYERRSKKDPDYAQNVANKRKERIEKDRIRNLEWIRKKREERKANDKAKERQELEQEKLKIEIQKAKELAYLQGIEEEKQKEEQKQLELAEKERIKKENWQKYLTTLSEKEALRKEKQKEDINRIANGFVNLFK